MECINSSRHLFTDFRKKPPALEEALEVMEYGEEKSKEHSEMPLERAMGKLEKFYAPGLTSDDIAAIFCYTYK